MASMNEKDYYAILGVDKNATTDEIRKVFQSKARTLHPDVNKAPDAEERFKEISEAYAVLSDPDKRRHYDAMRSGNPFASSMPNQPQGDTYSGSAGSPFGWGFPFGQAYSGTTTSRSYNPKVGADIVYQLDLDMESARNGCRRGVTYQRYGTCQACSGTGSVSSGESSVCPTCGGTGHVSVDLTGLFGIGVMNMVCPECEGTGRVVTEPCSECGGSGRVISASEVVIEIPPNSHDGDEIRMPGKGNVGTNGSASGDFVCRVGIPSERLDPRSVMGFQLLGFVLPFYVFAFIASVVPAVMFVCVIPTIAALVLIVSGGLTGKDGTWWKNAGSALVNGLSSGVIIALFTVAMMSCSGSLGSSRAMVMGMVS